MEGFHVIPNITPRPYTGFENTLVLCAALRRKPCKLRWHGQGLTGESLSTITNMIDLSLHCGRILVKIKEKS